MGRPQHTEQSAGVSVRQTPSESAFDDAAWLEDKYVTLIEEGPDPGPEVAPARRYDETQRIWCPRR